MGCSEKWSFNSLQVVQRFAGEERELSDHRVFQFLIGSLEIRCGPCSRRSAWPVSIPYRQSRDPRLAIPNNFAFSSFNSLQVVQRSKQVATPIIAIHGFNSLQVVQRFDLGSYLGVKKVVVSIPYRQSRDWSTDISIASPFEFQFLIGSLEMCICMGSRARRMTFQFLIGSLEIQTPLPQGAVIRGFNSLQVVQRSPVNSLPPSSITGFNSLQVVQRLHAG